MTSDKEGRAHVTSAKAGASAPKRRVPRPKGHRAAAAGSAGAAATVLVFIATQLGVSVTPEVASAATVLISTGAAYLLPDSYIKG